MSSPLLIIAGPTAVGKTALALDLARKLNGEILNIDSVQVYRGLDIGSAKPTLEERARVPHHLFDVMDPAEQGTVAGYLKLARAQIALLQEKGTVPICVGGTGLYITALLHGLVDLPKADPVLRAKLDARTTESVQSELRALDPEAAQKIHCNDRVRIIRALEAALLSGSSVSKLRSEHAHQENTFKALIVVPLLSRDELYVRINKRVDKMFERGLLDEVRGLVSQYGFDAPAFDAIGYRETVAALHNETALSELNVTIALNTRKFAKRQLTYWRNEPRKRGWKIRPYLDDESVAIAGASPVRRAVLKPIDALAWTREKLLNEVCARLAQPFESNELWFVQADREIK